MRDDPDILDPTFSRTYVGTVVMTALCDKLFDFDAKLNIVPVLATGYEWADSKNVADPVARRRAVPQRREIRRRCGEILPGTPPQCQRQLPPQRDRRDGPCRGGRSADCARRDEAGVLAVRRHPDRSRRHDAAAQGSRGRRQGFRPASGVHGPVPVRRARGTGPHHAGAIPRLLGRGAHPLRPRHLPHHSRQQHSPGQPAGRHAGSDRNRAARRGDGEARSEARAGVGAQSRLWRADHQHRQLPKAETPLGRDRPRAPRVRACAGSRGAEPGGLRRHLSSRTRRPLRRSARSMSRRSRRRSATSRRRAHC